MNADCKFGIELPNFVADIFLNKPERFFSQRLMPEGTVIPVQAYSVDRMAERIMEIGFDYAVYTMRPHDPDGAVNAAKWARKHGLAIALNNPACQIHGEPATGFNTWVYAPELVEKVKSEAELICLVYDELIHHQIHPGLTGHTNPWNALADVSDCNDILEAYMRIQSGLRKLFTHTAQTGIPAFTEQVVPALFHAVARNGGNPGCKVMKEQNSPISLSLCMSAARQYGSKWYATADLWEGDSGPWYQVMSRNSGHSPRELLSALKLIALLNPYAMMVEGGDLLWVTDSVNADLTEFGEITKYFFRDIKPKIKPAFDVYTWKPTIAMIHCEDGNYESPVSDTPEYINDPYFQPFRTRMLLGGMNLINTPEANKWLRAWYHLSWGKCSGKTLHNYFNPLEFKIARENDIGGDEHDILGCPVYERRRDPDRKETHMHSLFSPLNNIAVFDGYVTNENLKTAQLIILCGSYCTNMAQKAVIDSVKAGAICLCQAECAPKEYKNASGLKLGEGYWFTVPDFDSPAAIEQFLMFRGYQNQWVLNSDLGLLRIYPTDMWGNEIAWELETSPGRLYF